METRVIDFYDEFKCLGGQCPYSCCKGWAIAIDEYTYNRYKKEPGLKGKALLAFTRTNKSGVKTVRTLAGKCPYHTREGLCKHEKEGKKELMPYACRHYPRRSVSYWEYVEVTMELSCIRVAEIFVSNLGRRKFKKYMQLPAELETEQPMWKMGNKEPKFLKLLEKDREILLDYIWSEKENFCNAVRETYKFMYIKNMFLANDKLNDFAKVKLPVMQDITVEGENQLVDVPLISDSQKQYAFFPLWFINQLIYTKLLREDYKTENTFMKTLLKEYEECFGNITEKEADEFYNRNILCMLENYPKLKVLFVSYYSYLIQQSYCESYEDYYVLGPILLSIVQLQFLMEFFVCKFLKGRVIDDALMAEIIANTEKTIRHNLHFNDHILNEIRKVFF